MDWQLRTVQHEVQSTELNRNAECSIREVFLVDKKSRNDWINDNIHEGRYSPDSIGR